MSQESKESEGSSRDARGRGGSRQAHVSSRESSRDARGGSQESGSSREARAGGGRESRAARRVTALVRTFNDQPSKY